MNYDQTLNLAEELCSYFADSEPQLNANADITTLLFGDDDYTYKYFNGDSPAEVLGNLRRAVELSSEELTIESIGPVGRGKNKEVELRRANYARGHLNLLAKVCLQLLQPDEASQLKPVSVETALQRLNNQINNQRQVVYPNESGSFDLLDFSTINSPILCADVDLDGLCDELNILADDEFLCWPEEAVKLAA